MMFQGLLAALSLTTAAHASSHLARRHTHAPGPVDNTTRYDYVIVGSGPGGGPLAARLAIAGRKVLLIEAGGDYGDGYNQSVPAYCFKSAEDDNIKWDYYVHHYADLQRQKRDSKMTYKQTNGLLYTGLEPPEGAEPLGILYPRTGTLGGCAEHNAMITTYPFRSDWTYLQKITGDDSWAPDNMRGFFERLEKAEYPVGSGHGHDGWLHISLTNLFLVAKDLKVLSLVLSAASATGKGTGLLGLLSTVLSTVTALMNTLLTDLNSDSPGRDSAQDVYQVPLTIEYDTSKRSSPRSFLLDTANAKNGDGSRKYHLDIALNTLATRIRFDTSGDVPRALGVEYLSGARLYTADPHASGSGVPGYVRARKEVIICAGTFNTPQLLKLSGIGPKDELDQFGIPVVKDVPGVGQNMQDRYEAAIVLETAEKFSLSAPCTFGYDGQPDPCLDEWIHGHNIFDRGPYTTSGAAVGIKFKPSWAASGADTDIFVVGTPGDFRGFYPDFAHDAIRTARRWSWLALKAHSHNNAGTVKLRSTDPRDVPDITFHSFDTGNTTDGGDEKDLQALYEGLLWGREANKKLIPLDGSFTEILPGANYSSEDTLKDFIRNEAWGHHACCTVKIGAKTDPTAVLDTNFKVRGVRGLRVVDASVFPKIPGMFIAMPLYMVSEKAAQVIIDKD